MGHIQDRWFRPARDAVTEKVILNARGKPVMERSELYGIGLRYKVRYLDPDNNERSKSFADKQKKRAEDFLIGVESDKREDKYIDPRASMTTFRQQAESWVKSQSPDPGTRSTILSRLESQIYPVFETKKVGQIKPSTIRDWVGSMEERKLSDNYQAVLFNTVSGVMDSAVDDRRIRENPCHAKTVRRPVASSPPIVVWPEERVQVVRSGLADRFKIAVPLGAGFGLRQGEILGFSPDDVDRTAMTVRIRRQIKTVRGVMMFALPKRGKERTIPLSAAMLAEIDDHEDRFPSVAVTLPWQSADGDPVTARLLMTGEAGRLYSGDLFTKVVWHGAFRTAGITYRGRADGMHALRHFYASTLLARAVSITELADYLGHADPGFTLRTYTHLVPSSHQRAREAVDAVFGRPALDDGLEAA
ncbi:tyrosine-type recombinase/integrase [Amycolatopsis vastitatis]|uniref:Site-specific integrase n=1 Tax=Amycolatopsis vastitatis TaxID=1905142 RepID=A0A229T9U1_9PSEU|nr:site-specific integrase [Amycolatopsis vastitatis]OXM67918.1 site-specific integrase [Amycolatopsis vastitatis]